MSSTHFLRDNPHCNVQLKHTTSPSREAHGCLGVPETKGSESEFEHVPCGNFLTENHFSAIEPKVFTMAYAKSTRETMGCWFDIR